jgi:hypothetical protein
MLVDDVSLDKSLDHFLDNMDVESYFNPFCKIVYCC